MRFDFKTATDLVKHYQYLIGKSFDKSPSNYNINYIVIAPDYGKELERFWEYFIREEDYEIALQRAGFNQDSVLVFLVYLDPYSNVLLYNELDDFIKATKTEKFY